MKMFIHLLLSLILLTLMGTAQATFFINCSAYENDKVNYFLSINPETQTIVSNFSLKDPNGLNGLGNGERYINVMRELKGPMQIAYNPEELHGTIEILQKGTQTLSITLNYTTGTRGRALGARFYNLDSISGGPWAPFALSENYCDVEGL